MKWIGQYIFDFAVRIRDKLYDSTGSSGSPASSVNKDLSASTTGFAKTLTTDGSKMFWTDATYIHSQTSTAHTWTIDHNLNRFPSVMVVDTDSPPKVIVANIVYDSSNRVTLTFFSGEGEGDTSALQGKAYFN